MSAPAAATIAPWLSVADATRAVDYYKAAFGAVERERLDALFARAVAAGATVIAPVHEEHGWRVGRIADPAGHHWELARRS